MIECHSITYEDMNLIGSRRGYLWELAVGITKAKMISFYFLDDYTAGYLDKCTFWTEFLAC